MKLFGGKRNEDTLELQVEGMSCDHCAGRVRTVLEEMDGVRSVKVRLATGVVVVRGQNLESDRIRERIEATGYRVF